MPFGASATITTTASGTAFAYPAYGGGGQSYSLQKTSSIPLGSFADGVSSAANWSTPFGESWANASACSSSNIESLFRTDPTSFDLSMSADLRAESGGFVGYPVISESCDSAMSLLIEFTLADAAEFILELENSGFHTDSPTHFLEPRFLLSSLDNGYTLELTDLTCLSPGPFGASSDCETLLPGSYRLLLESDAWTMADPLGDMAIEQTTLHFRVTTVDESGFTLSLLSAGLACLLGLRFGHKRWPASRRAA